MDSSINNYEGSLRIDVTTDNLVPVAGANILVSFSGDPDSLVLSGSTNVNGQSGIFKLAAPSLSYSLSPSSVQPYSEYTIKVKAAGFVPYLASGVEILPDEVAILPVVLERDSSYSPDFEVITVPAHTLYGDYPPKIAESEIKPVNASGEIVLSRVVVPEYIIVHDGAPSDPTAKDYYVRYSDYIANVASSEIYSTWPDEAIRANVLAIMSFTLNRVYTEWYRNKGYDFTITSSTAFDHKWVYGRNIFENISLIVDELFGYYISRPNVKQPILTQYCDGRNTVCPNWMT